MGLFDHFKKKPKQTPEVPPAGQPENSPQALLEIASIISNQDPDVLEEVRLCLKDTMQYAEMNCERYAQRYIELDLVEPELLRWIGLVDCLEYNGYVCERDWKDEKPDFVHFLKSCRGMARLGLTLDENWLDESTDISDWIHVINQHWATQACCVSVIDIDSDSYVLFPCTTAERAQLKELAAQLEQRIE